MIEFQILGLDFEFGDLSLVQRFKVRSFHYILKLFISCILSNSAELRIILSPVSVVLLQHRVQLRLHLVQRGQAALDTGGHDELSETNKQVSNQLY